MSIKHAVTMIMYPVGVFLSKIPTLVYGIGEMRPLKVMWREQYKQSYPQCVWFNKYPNQMPKPVSIGKNSNSSGPIEIYAIAEIKIGSHVAIGHNLKILDRKSSHGRVQLKRGEGSDAKIDIGDNVFIGEDCKIIVGDELLTICNDAIIGAGSIVTKSIKKKGVYAGVPARYLS